MKPANRRRTWRYSRWGEAVAMIWLWLKGYSLVTRNFTLGRGTGAGEVDMVVRRGTVIAFVEVKLRPTLAASAEAIQARQRQRIVRAARAFVSGRPDLAACDIRFDAVLLAPWRLPCHVPDAWRMEA